MSRLFLITAATVLVLAAVLGVLAFCISAKNWDEFSGDLLLNLAAEFLGIALGVLMPLFIASWFVREKLNVLARPIVELIARLRVEGKLSEQAARSCVKCAVTIISEESFKEGYTLSIWPKEGVCDVCALKIDLRPNNKCQHCGLSDHIWKLPPKTKEAALRDSQ